MLSWLGQNIGWILVLAGLIAMVAVLVANLIFSRHQGGCPGCAGCAYAKNCPSAHKKSKKQ